MLAKNIMLPTTEVVHLDQTLQDAATRLRRFELPALPVVDGDEIVGLLTAEAVKEALASAGADLLDIAVRDRMSAEIAFCRGDESIETARAVMEEGGYRRLLVVDHRGRLCGLLSSTDAEAQGKDSSEVAAAHTVKTPGRATGGALRQPPSFSVKPVIKK